MHLFGFSKKTKKRLSSGPLNLGLRRSKSTGNIPSHDNATERDDSSTDSSGGSSANSNNDMKKQQTDQQFQEKPSTIGRNEKPTQKGLVLETPAPQAQVQAQAADDTKLPPLTAAMDRLNIKENGIPSTHSDDSLVSKAVTTEPTKQQPQQTKTGGGAWKSGGDEKWNSNGINPEDLDSLLSMETQQRVEAQRERRDKAAAAVESAPTTPLRPTRLKFELPVTPSRSRSPSNQPITYPRARPRSHSEESHLSVDRRKPSDATTGRGGGKQAERKRRHRRWSKLMGSDTEDDDGEEAGAVAAKRKLELGAYVTLIKRPLPTMGYVRYIGPVEGEPGDWVGVELEHRVGNCDGLIKGQRFFKTDPQRGIFTKRFDLEVVVV